MPARCAILKSRKDWSAWIEQTNTITSQKPKKADQFCIKCVSSFSHFKQAALSASGGNAPCELVLDNMRCIEFSQALDTVQHTTRTTNFVLQKRKHDKARTTSDSVPGAFRRDLVQTLGVSLARHTALQCLKQSQGITDRSKTSVIEWPKKESCPLILEKGQCSQKAMTTIPGPQL